jgi:hypothetical protein
MAEEEITGAITWALNDKGPRSEFHWANVLNSPAELRKKRGGPADISKFAKILKQWKAKKTTSSEQRIEQFRQRGINDKNN